MTRTKIFITHFLRGTLIIVLSLSLVSCSTHAIKAASARSHPEYRGAKENPSNSDCFANDSQRCLQIALAIQNTFIRIFEQAQPAIVGVIAYNVRNPLAGMAHFWDRIPKTNGTGFIFRDDGYILTNDHVVDDAEHIEVTLIDGRTMRAQLIGVDPNTDIAVIKIDTDTELPIITLADSNTVKPGQFTIAIGNPFGLDYSVTTGIVSGKGRDLRYNANNIILYHDFIQTDAWINRGNSGGPLLNIFGEVIGMNAMIRAEGRMRARFSGAGFAISSNMIKDISRRLIAKGRIDRGWLGVRMQEEDNTVKVTEVIKNSPVAQSGMEVGDIIVEYQGQPIISTKALQWAVADTKAEQVVDIKVRRGQNERILKVTIGAMPAKHTGQLQATEAMMKLGMIVHELTNSHIKRFSHLTKDDKGVIVQNINPKGLVARNGIRKGDLIIAIDGKKIHNLEECNRAFDTALKTKIINITVKTSGDDDIPQKKSVTIKLSD